MGISDAVKEIIKASEGIEGLEVNINGGDIDIYWENLRLTLTPANLDKGIKAIKTLVSLNVSFE